MRGPDLRSIKQDTAKLRQAAANVDPQTLNQVQQAVQKYQGKDETELVNELSALALQARQSGSLDNARIDNIAEALGPMLNSSQQATMQKLIQQLKG